MRNKDSFTMRMPHHELIAFRGNLLLISSDQPSIILTQPSIILTQDSPMRQKVLMACQLQYQQDVVCHILVTAVVVDDHLMFWAVGHH